MILVTLQVLTHPLKQHKPNRPSPMPMGQSTSWVPEMVKNFYNKIKTKWKFSLTRTPAIRNCALALSWINHIRGWTWILISNLNLDWYLDWFANCFRFHNFLAFLNRNLFTSLLGCDFSNGFGNFFANRFTNWNRFALTLFFRFGSTNGLLFWFEGGLIDNDALFRGLQTRISTSVKTAKSKISIF